MDIKKIRSDFDNGVLISRSTWEELLTHAEQADAVLAGRQQKIGEQSFTIARLEQDCRDWQKAHQDAVALPHQPNNPAAHDWVAPASEGLPDLIARLRASVAGKESYEEATVFVANIAAAIQFLERGVPNGWWKALNDLSNNLETFGEYGQETARIAIECCMNALEELDGAAQIAPLAVAAPDRKSEIKEAQPTTSQTMWRVGEFISSSSPENTVLCLALAHQIYAYENRVDFIRWVSPNQQPIAAPAYICYCDPYGKLGLCQPSQQPVPAMSASISEHFCCVAKPEGSTGPSFEAPYTHWMPLPAAPVAAIDAQDKGTT